MARVLIQMRAAIMRRATSGRRWIGILLLALLVTLLAVTTLLAAWRTTGTREPGPMWWRPSVSAGCSAGSRARC